ncbi:cytosolic endo-beta-N-acetylglucosaminidase-like [Stylophora pistillata]|uniref:cytosolic endo-beta-N-acetylglucosaminidase-like n=1 Tax=Stylophora pistillata TaxID=50429 RepID=UPI000C0566BF|nr:cytosolic endo-beta-N-acetylglucosaminidase-like [Stylophora pistillata]
MAEDMLLLLLWTVLAVLFGIYTFWKYLRSGNINSQKKLTVQASENVKEARLKYFIGNQEGVRSETRDIHVSTNSGEKDESISPEELREEEREPDVSEAKINSEARQPSMQYAKLIDGPSKMSGSRQVADNSFDPETGMPVTRPLKTLDEALSWRQGFDFFNVASVPLSEQGRKIEKRPRTLVCHDMKGGYTYDRFVQGYPSCDCYRIYHWQFIDVFVYFSHHFVTIPPPCWTNAAHTHGVPILGTLITENTDGVAMCSKFLEDTSSLEALVNQLVDIAEYYGFDGWLLNIENPIQPVQINNLEEFVKSLTTKMHQSIPNSLVIWYDSVTYKGDLSWQNELNAKNRVFFDACDGIFLNYNWSEAHLMRSAAAAGRARQTDVYVGVDVFGRGCYGGGGYNSKVAFKVFREEKLSAALFAPGWVMEKHGSEHFTVNNDKFWNLLAPYCTVRTSIVKLPLVTSICRGYGKTASIDGKTVLSTPWTNLSAQQYQLSFNNTFFNLGDKEGLVISSVEFTLDEAYNGGGCQVISGCVNSSQAMSKGVVRLFKTDLPITGPFLVSFSFKLCPSVPLVVALQLHLDKMPTYIVLCPTSPDDQDPGNSEETEQNDKLIRRYGVPKSRLLTSSVFMSPIGQEHYRLFQPLTGSFHDSVQQAHGLNESRADCVSDWCTRYYLIAEKELVGLKVQEVRVICALSPGAQTTGAFKLHVGEIKIIDPRVIIQPIALAKNLRYQDIEWISTDDGYLLSLTLIWHCPISDGQCDEPAHYNIFRVAEGSSVFLGRAFVEAYRIGQIAVSKTCSSVTFAVQIVTRSGRKRPPSQCSHFTLKW